MHAITIRPPWSQIIAEAAALTALSVAPKAVENRGRPVADKHIGQDIAIHAGLTWCKVGEADERVREAWFYFANAFHTRGRDNRLTAIGDTRTGYVGGLRPGLWIEQGAVIAVATLVDCHPAITIPVTFDYPAHVCCTPWGEATHNGKPAWHLVLDDVRRLREPVPARGSLAVPWTLLGDVAAQVEQQLAVTVR